MSYKKPRKKSQWNLKKIHAQNEIFFQRDRNHKIEPDYGAEELNEWMKRMQQRASAVY